MKIKNTETEYRRCLCCGQLVPAYLLENLDICDSCNENSLVREDYWESGAEDDWNEIANGESSYVLI